MGGKHLSSKFRHYYCDEFVCDGVHPTQAGLKFMAETIFKDVTSSKDFILMGEYRDSTIFSLPIKYYICLILLINLALLVSILFKS